MRWETPLRADFPQVFDEPQRTPYKLYSLPQTKAVSTLLSVSRKTSNPPEIARSGDQQRRAKFLRPSRIHMLQQETLDRVWGHCNKTHLLSKPNESTETNDKRKRMVTPARCHTILEDTLANCHQQKTGCFGSTCTVEIVILLVMCGGCTVVPVDLHVIHVRLQIQRWVHIEHKSRRVLHNHTQQKNRLLGSWKNVHDGLV